jgi:hypothetical protein
MHLPTLSTLGLFVLGTAHFVSAQQVADFDSIATTPQAYSAYYLSAFGDEASPEVDFELVQRGANDLSAPTVQLAKRADCSKYHTGKSSHITAVKRSSFPNSSLPLLVSGSDNCISLSKKYGIKLDQFYDWNPQVNHKCTNLNNGKKYCIAAESGSGSSNDDNHASSGCAKTQKGR